MLDIIKLLEKETKHKCYKSYKYCVDSEPTISGLQYEESQSFTLLKDRYGEDDHSLKSTKDMTELASLLHGQQSIFRYFLDGSRKAYKIDDIEVNKRVFPIIAGQVSVACCERSDEGKFHSKIFENSLVVALPSEANPEVLNPKLFYNKLASSINSLGTLKKLGLYVSNVYGYDSKRSTDSDKSKYESLGIACVQDEMTEYEKKVVSSLANKNLLSNESYLLKDGSLQYKINKTSNYQELSKIKNNFRWVVGVSKLFNPEFSKDRSGKSNAAALASLPLFHRTPAYMFQHDPDKWSYLGDHKYCVWYIRIRESKYTASPFSGIVKVEKLLITEKENNDGIDSDVVDNISASIINERNPVCYGKDSRWANHLYPVHVTEMFLKSNFLSDTYFLNLF